MTHVSWLLIACAVPCVMSDITSAGSSWSSLRKGTFTKYCPTAGGGECTEVQPSAVLAGSFNSTVITRTLNASNEAELQNYCSKQWNATINWRNNQTKTVQQLMIDLRLGDGKTTGKIKARNAVYGTLRNNLIQKWPELFDPILTAPRGSVAIGDMPNARLDVLQEQFVLGITYFTQPQPAYLNITRNSIYTPNITMASMIDRAHARINEVRGQQREVLSIIVPRDAGLNFSYPDNVTIEELLLTFNKALGTPDATSSICTSSGCTPVLLLDGATTINLPNGTLPDANNTNLNQTFTSWDGKGLQTAYNLVAWDGNTTAYMTGNLAQRGKDYIGSCVQMDVSCASNTEPTMPFHCLRLADNTNVTGFMNDTNYRTQCEAPCDKQLDCNTLCECFGTCSATQMCVCPVCASEEMNLNAVLDASFADIQRQASSNVRFSDWGCNLPAVPYLLMPFCISNAPPTCFVYTLDC